jgi:hypothetical protein
MIMNTTNVQQEITWTKTKMCEVMEQMNIHSNKAKFYSEKMINDSKILELYCQKLRTLENKLKNQEVLTN